MVGEYSVTLKITVIRGTGDTKEQVAQEETTFPNLSFATMTRLSSEYYELVNKLSRERK
jgi:hypothetical protein